MHSQSSSLKLIITAGFCKLLQHGRLSTCAKLSLWPSHCVIWLPRSLWPYQQQGNHCGDMPLLSLGQSLTLVASGTGKSGWHNTDPDGRLLTSMPMSDSSTASPARARGTPCVHMHMHTKDHARDRAEGGGQHHARAPACGRAQPHAQTGAWHAQETHKVHPPQSRRNILIPQSSAHGTVHVLNCDACSGGK